MDFPELVTGDREPVSWGGEVVCHGDAFSVPVKPFHVGHAPFLCLEGSLFLEHPVHAALWMDDH